MGDNIKRVLGK